MKNLFKIFWFCTCMFILNTINNPSFGEEIQDDCVECICEATSNCNRNAGCTDDGVCGPLRLTKPFWIDGGMFHFKGRDPKDPKAFQECANNLYCASETLRGYSRRYARDCDGNGLFCNFVMPAIYNCYDYMKIHEMGPNGCTNNDTDRLNQPFFVKTRNCLTKLKQQ